MTPNQSASPQRRRRNRIREAAQHLSNRGFSVLPLRERDKVPAGPWRNIDYAASDFAPRNNLGVKLGSVSGGLIDVDLDSDLCRYFTDLLPPTNLKFGRQSRQVSHLLYTIQSPDRIRRRHYSFPEVGGIVEIRGEGHVTMFPPSEHPEDGYLLYVDEGEPGITCIEALTTAVSQMAAGVLIATQWPQGNRHNCALALSAVLLRSFSEDFTSDFLDRICQAAGDDEIGDRLATIPTSRQRMREGNTATGIPRLRELLGTQVVTKVLDWLKIENVCNESRQVGSGQPGSLNFERLNSEYAAVPIMGKQRIIRLDHLDEEPLTTRGFIDLLKGQTVWIDGKRCNLGQAWLDSEERRQYQGVEFAPRGGNPQYFNLFRGFPIDPVPGDASLYWQFVRDVIADGDDETYQYIRKWLAYCFRRPELPVGTALVIIGRQGTGKSFFVDPISRLMGRYSFKVNRSDQLVGKFGGGPEEALLIHIEESNWVDRNKEGMATLKAMITDSIVTTEKKYQNAKQRTNYRKIVITSNEARPILLEAGDRRMVVLSASDCHLQDSAYFAAINNQLVNGGYEALMHDLCSEDLDGFLPSERPAQRSSWDVKLRSLPSVEEWLFYWLLNSDSNHFNHRCEKQEIYRCFVEYCKDGDLARRGHAEFSRDLISILRPISESRPSRNGSRIRCYDFPALEVLRTRFQAFVGEGEEIWNQ